MPSGVLYPALSARMRESRATPRNPDHVVSDCRGDSADVGPVSMMVHWIAVGWVWIFVRRDVAGGHEVIAVDVVHIAVHVVVDTRRTVELGPVRPHVGSEVWMVVVDSRVDDPDHDAGVALLDRPRTWSCNPSEGPLLRKQGVVSQNPLGRRAGFRRDWRAQSLRFQEQVRFHGDDSGVRSEARHGFPGRHLCRQLDEIDGLLRRSILGLRAMSQLADFERIDLLEHPLKVRLLTALPSCCEGPGSGRSGTRAAPRHVRSRACPHLFAEADRHLSSEVVHVKALVSRGISAPPRSNASRRMRNEYGGSMLHLWARRHYTRGNPDSVERVACTAHSDLSGHAV